MKNTLLVIFTFFGLVFAGAQNFADNAIGLRLGDNDGLGAEITYQRALSDNNRAELDFGFRSKKNTSAIKLTGLYQWVWAIDNGFNWYAGPGAGFASYKADSINGKNYSETYLFAAGDVGIEYNFNAPWQISLDFRPEFGFGSLNNDTAFDIAFSVRYKL